MFGDDFDEDFRRESGNPRVKQNRFRFRTVLRRSSVWGFRERQREKGEERENRKREFLGFKG